MPRRHRIGIAGIPHHVINRACRRATIFETPEDYAAFLEVIREAKAVKPTQILSFAVMPNHWHFILWPRSELELSAFMHWLTGTHTQRWHTAHGTSGTGPLYQGRYKALPIQSDEHLLTVAKYVERNPVRAGLVERVEDWRWSSGWIRHHQYDTELLDGWPLPLSEDWVAALNEPQNQIHLSRIRESITRGAPFGDANWRPSAASALRLLSTIRPQGRPCKK
jgi:putative transposase